MVIGYHCRVTSSIKNGTSDQFLGTENRYLDRKVYCDQDLCGSIKSCNLSNNFDTKDLVKIVASGLLRVELRKQILQSMYGVRTELGIQKFLQYGSSLKFPKKMYIYLW